MTVPGRVLGVALLAALFLALLTTGSSRRWQRPPARSAVTAMLLLSLLAVSVSKPAEGAIPDADTLESLKERLTQPPDCTPTCAEATSAQVAVRGDRLDVSLQVSALANIAVRLPSAGDRWQLDTVLLDEG